MYIDTHHIRNYFHNILKDPSPEIRESKTKFIFREMQRQNVAFDPTKELPLRRACRLGDVKIVQLFLENGAVLDEQRTLIALNNARKNACKVSLQKDLEVVKAFLLTDVCLSPGNILGVFDQAVQNLPRTYKLKDSTLIALLIDCGVLDVCKVFEALDKSRKSVCKEDRRKYRQLRCVKDLTVKINAQAKSFDRLSYTTGINFLDSLHLACFLSQSQRDGYFHKSNYRLPASVSINKKEARVIFKRRNHREKNPNIIGSGSSKEAYPALQVKIKARRVVQAVQIVPVARGSRFEDGEISEMLHFTKQKEGFPGFFFYGIHVSKTKRELHEIIFQPFWSGGSLNRHTKKYLESHGKTPLSFSVQISIALGLSKGLQTLHENGNVHGDMKPGNCLYDKKKSACITDFGFVYKEGTHPKNWFENVFYGTPPYTPPEFLLEKFMDYGAGQPGDMYALGLILYELAFGRPLWYDALEDHYSDVINILDDYQMRVDISSVSMKVYINGMKKPLEKYNVKRNIIYSYQCKMWKDLKRPGIPGPEQRYRFLIAELLHPDPVKRITINEFRAKLKNI